MSRAPEEHLALPEKITTHTGRLHSLQLLSSSDRKDVLRVCAERGDFVLKVCCISVSKWLFNESRALHELGLYGTAVAPRCFLEATILGDRCYLLTDFLPGASIAGQLGVFERPTQPDIVKEAASLLRKVHDLPIEPPGSSGTLDALLEVAEANRKGGLLDPTEFANDDPRRMLDWLDAARPRHYHTVFSHGDYRPKNLLRGLDQMLSLIDWEHAIWCSPFYDLAVFRYYLKTEELEPFCEAYGLNTLDEEQLLYFDRLSKFLNV